MATPPLSEQDMTEATRFNLLHDSIVSVNHQNAKRMASLPDVYASLVRDEVDDFPGLRPHQRHFWHATLCQIGAIAMVHADTVDPPDEPGSWRDILRVLTRDGFPGDEPWCLCVEGLTRPAFLQPGASSDEKIADYKTVIVTPDQMDLPVGSKHHDVRDLNMRHASPEQWLFSLVARQTGGGYDGSHLYGISRMNGGLGNRHGFSLTPSTRWGAHVSRDLKVLARQHFGEEVRRLLLWTRPWDGTREETLLLHELEPLPLYVEVSRRIRLEVDAEGNVSGRRATSRSPRIHARESKGLTGDPWTITETDKSVTVGGSGFGYRQVSRYLGHNLPLLSRPEPTVDGNSRMHLVARAIVRGQGRTDGYHERTIPLARGVAAMLRSASGQARLHSAAEARLKIIGEVQNILGHSVKTYLQDGVSDGRTRPEHQKVIAAARRRLDLSVDIEFWTRLQEELESPEPQRTKSEWCHRRLIRQARRILDDMVRSGLCHRQEQFRATTEAIDLFGRRVRDNPRLPEPPED